MTTTNWDLVTQALIKVVILSFLVERSLAVMFDMDGLRALLKRKRDIKPIVAILVSVGACFALHLDAFAPLGAIGATLAEIKWLGYFLTGLVVSGGSAGSVKLFQDILGFRRSSREQIKAVEELEQQAAATEARARVEKAQAEIAVARSNTMVAGSRVSSAAFAGDSPEQQILLARMAERDLKIARGG